MEPEEIANDMDDGISIVTWFSDHHDADLRDIFELCQEASGNQVRMIEHPEAPYGYVIVVYSGRGDASDEMLRQALSDEGY